MKIVHCVSSVLLSALVAGYPAMASAQTLLKTADNMLTNATGMTLYTFDKDIAGAGKSVCNGPCATNWPPLMAQGSDKAVGDYSIVVRDDGTKQWAFRGKPLYQWNKDQKPGDKTGDGINNLWHVAKP